ncbi:hypothetical protein HanRHA438_Chr06g0278521 [Helianthus annuus]|nr:hypothetical protein HanRHA438_Chr06g0278521 [Helianthus annuus]
MNPISIIIALLSKNHQSGPIGVTTPYFLPGNKHEPYICLYCRCTCLIRVTTPDSFRHTCHCL